MNKFYGAGNLEKESEINPLRGEMRFNAFVVISKDFKTMYGYVPAIDKYGGAYFKSDKNIITREEEYIKYRKEEPKRIALYIEALRGAFEIANGGNGFIAVKTETLTGINNEVAKQQVLDGLNDLSENVHEYEFIKEDTTKFNYQDGYMLSTVNGTILFVYFEEYNGDEATIKVTSWFGNMGAVTPTYKAIYKDEKWHLKQIGMEES